MANETFGTHIAKCSDSTVWIELIWKMLWSNKAILPLLWEMFSGRPNLLPAFDGRRPPASDHVLKPKLAREGANVTLTRGGSVVDKTTGDYGAEGYVAQALYELPNFGGHRPVLGSWIVDGEPAGMGICEGGLIVTTITHGSPPALQEPMLPRGWSAVPSTNSGHKPCLNGDASRA